MLIILGRQQTYLSPAHIASICSSDPLYYNDFRKAISASLSDEDRFV
ncbi:MAG: hypothetical protein ACJAW1_000734 [Glaciecola sp.]|jgi:hypothetical protein